MAEEETTRVDRVDFETELLALEVDLRDRLRLDPLALEREFIEVPAHIAYIGGQHGRAIKRHLLAKIRSKKLWGLLLIQARETLEEENDIAQAKEERAAEVGKRKAKDMKTRITESMVESQAQQMAAWQAAQEEESTAEALREVSKTNIAAILAKKDMLVQMGANARAEMERDPVIRDRMRVQRDS